MWRHKIAWCRGCVTCLWNVNLGSVLTKIKIFNFHTTVANFFCNQFRDLLFENFYKVFKIRQKYLINWLFLLVFSSLPNQIFHSRCNTLKRVTSRRGPSPCHWALATQLLSKKYRSGGEPLKHCFWFDQPEIWTSEPPAPYTNVFPLDQLVRPGATGGIPGPCPLKSLLVPPPQTQIVPPLSEDCVPKKFTGSIGATGVQFEAWDSQNTGYY